MIANTCEYISVAPFYPEYMWCVSAYLPHQLPFPVYTGVPTISRSSESYRDITADRLIKLYKMIVLLNQESTNWYQALHYNPHISQMQDDIFSQNG